MKRAIVASMLLFAASATLAQQSSYVQPQALGVPPSFNPIFTRATQIHGIDTPTGELVGNLARLKQKALAGDSQASAQLYAGLSECKGVFKQPKSPFYHEHCVGITQADLDESGKWLDLAAEKGSKEAQYGYAVGGFDDIVGVQNAKKNSALFSAYKSNSKKYLLGLASECNYDAIAAIASSASTNGLIFGDDPVTGYKYLLVQKTITRQAQTATSSLSDQYQQTLENKISSKSVLSATQQEALIFVNQYCK
jgi:hypothetical protein